MQGASGSYSLTGMAAWVPKTVKQRRQGTSYWRQLATGAQPLKGSLLYSLLECVQNKTRQILRFALGSVGRPNTSARRLL
jgi:hypothetical protein